MFLSSVQAQRTRRRSNPHKKTAPLPPASTAFEGLEPRLLLSAPAAFNASGLGGGGWFGPTSINPYNSNEIFLPTDMGELFHSTDGAATWTYPTTIGQSYRSPVQFTGSASVMWAINASTARPAKSTDGGNTWADASSWTSTSGSAYFLYTDPTLASNFIVCSAVSGTGTGDRVYLSTNGGTSWANVYTGDPGTTSGGGARELVVSGLFKDGTRVWIPTSLGILYSSNSGGSFALLSVPWSYSTEACTSMAASKSGTTIRFLATTVSPDALYAGNVFEWSSKAQNVYLSDFNVTTGTQGTWTNITSRLPPNKHEGFAAMAQGNITTLYLGGSDDRDYGVPSVLKSTDGGLTWRETFQYVNNANVATNQYGYWGGDYDYAWAGGAFSLQVCSNDPNRVTISDMGTAWMTTDGGEGGANTSAATADWRDITVAPQYLHTPGTVAPAGTTAYAGSADNTAAYNLTFLSPTNVFMAMTDQTGMYSTNGGASWYYPTYNSGAKFSNFFDVTADYRTGVLFAAAGRQNDLFKSWRLYNSNRDGRGGGLDYSTDGGKTWSLLHQWTNTDSSINPLAKVVVDPNVPGRAYALVDNSVNGGIWRTDNLYLADGKTVNASATWTQLTVPTRTFASSFTYGFGGYSHTYAAGAYEAHDPSDLDVLSDGTLVATFDIQYDSTGSSYRLPVSGVFVSTDGGSTWTDRSLLNLTVSNMMFFTQKVCIDPQDASQNTWYAATDFIWPDYRQNNYGVLKTTDRGAHWTQIFTGNVGDNGLGVNNVTVNPDTGDMYLSTSSNGIYYSATKSNFTKLTQEHYAGIDNVVVNPYRTSQVWVCTHGNGLQKGDTAATDSPSDLRAGSAVGHQVAINWTAVGGATGYQVQYTTGAVNWTGTVTWTTAASLPAGSTSANVDGLASNSSYYFRVVPMNGAAPMGNSNIISAPILASPTAVAATSASPHEADVTWQYSGTILGAKFRIQRSTDNLNWTDLGTTANTNVTSYADTTAAAGTFYYYRVLTISADGSFLSLPSGAAGVKTFPAGGLIAYDGFFYGTGAVIGGQGSAGSGWAGAWTVVADSPANLNIAAASLTSPGDLATSSLNRLSLGATGGSATRNTAVALSSYGTTLWASALIKTNWTGTYRWGSLTIGNVIVEFHDRTGGSNYEWAMLGPGDTWYGTSWGTGRAPAVTDTTYFVVVKITFGTGSNHDSVRVWLNPTPGSTAPSDASSFDYKASINAGGTLTTVKAAGSYYANTQYDEIRLGAAYADVAPLALPAAPTGLAATAGATQVNLQWTNSTGTRTGFHVQQSLDGLAWATVATITNPAATTAAVSGLTPNKTYSFRVTAYNDSGDSAGSNVATASIYRLAGDANSDGIVDQADYTLWYNSYGAAGTWAQGDFNGDSLVDQADYTLWYNGYGSSTVYGSGGSAPTGDSIGETGAMAAIVTQDAAPTLLVAAAASQQQLVANNRPLPALGLLDSVATSDGLELLDVLALTSLRSAV